MWETARNKNSVRQFNYNFSDNSRFCNKGMITDNLRAQNRAPKPTQHLGRNLALHGLPILKSAEQNCTVTCNRPVTSYNVIHDIPNI